MPKVNADGNETVGIPSIQHQVPLGTYTGWNMTAGGFFKGQPCGGGLTGGAVSFPSRTRRLSARLPAIRVRLSRSDTARRKALCVPFVR